MVYGLWTKECFIRMSNKLILIVMVVLVVGAGLFFIRGSPSANGKVVSENSEDSGEIQEITLGMKNGNYYPNTVKVNVNQPVRIYLEDSVFGCYRSFTIREFGISKNLRTSSDYVEFTPTKKGSYRFACSMGMGTGTLIVE